MASAVRLGLEKSTPEVRAWSAPVPSIDSFRPARIPASKVSSAELPAIGQPPRLPGPIHYFRVEWAFRADLDHDLRRSWRSAPATAAVAFCRNSRRNAFGARSVATVIVTGGRPSAWSRRKASVRRRSFFQHSRSQVPTARCTQNSSSYSSFSRSWSGLLRSPAPANTGSAYVEGRRRQKFFVRGQRRRYPDRAG